MDITTLALAKNYVNKKFGEAISFGGFQIVEELPAFNISRSTVYLLLKDATNEGNLYFEYIYTLDNKWELIGSTLETGATFTPHITEDGLLSWTNDKNLTNPDPVNIKGPQGNSGVYVGSGDMPEDYNVQIDINGKPYSYTLSEEEKEEIINRILAEIENREESQTREVI